MISSAFQINLHAAVTVNAVVFMIDFFDLCLNFSLLSIVTRLPVFPVVVVSIWIDFQARQ